MADFGKERTRSGRTGDDCRVPKCLPNRPASAGAMLTGGMVDHSRPRQYQSCWVSIRTQTSVVLHVAKVASSRIKLRKGTLEDWKQLGADQTKERKQPTMLEQFISPDGPRLARLPIPRAARGPDGEADMRRIMYSYIVEARSPSIRLAKCQGQAMDKVPLTIVPWFFSPISKQHAALTPICA
ncbi:hypothetical protein BKA56DRAFT_607740 [Ilyonectria sp. MPI-CAGE-AT-0026]|nr:hypothetical protein BKA56DRAFT_607740 [Ilyonectria sp. MPI-CAGE-AT-0026]